VNKAVERGSGQNHEKTAIDKGVERQKNNRNHSKREGRREQKKGERSIRTTSSHLWEKSKVRREGKKTDKELNGGGPEIKTKKSNPLKRGGRSDNLSQEQSSHKVEKKQDP